jgi:aryl-alcohol dehydrogenase-like predicted oxidoreductase
VGLVRSAVLGTTGATISRIGIGGWQAGGTGPWGGGPRADDDAAIAAIRRALGGGVNWVDTAASYGLGHSEEVVARAIAPRSIGDEVLVFTKCGHPWDPPDEIRTDLGPDSIRHVDCVQPELSLLRREALEDVIPWCGAHGTGVLGYSPLGTGALARTDDTATHGQGEGDEVLLARGLAVQERLREIGNRVGVTTRELAVAWALSNTDVTAVICGARTPGQVDGWIGASDVALSPDVVAEIEAVSGTRGFAAG